MKFICPVPPDRRAPQNFGWGVIPCSTLRRAQQIVTFSWRAGSSSFCLFALGIPSTTITGRPLSRDVRSSEDRAPSGRSFTRISTTPCGEVLEE
jgi:hypothetical protein